MPWQHIINLDDGGPRFWWKMYTQIKVYTVKKKPTCALYTMLTNKANNNEDDFVKKLKSIGLLIYLPFLLILVTKYSISSF